MVTFRPAAHGHASFLAEMLAVAADWRSDSPRSTEDVLRDPPLAHYVAGWPRQGDFGVVAEEMEVPVGAAWCRFFSEDDPGYGFVDGSTPELSIGVVSGARRRGIGRGLLERLIEQACERNVERLSLSVEVDNPARGVYERLGFEANGTLGDAVTMVRHCSPRRRSGEQPRR